MLKSIILKIFIISIVIANISEAKKYYLDASNGNDKNSGLSSNSAWKTINKVNDFAFLKGDIIAFKKGQTFKGYTLCPNRNKLTFTTYGIGNKPIIDGEGTKLCVSWNNLNNLTFCGIEFVNGYYFNLNTDNSNYLIIDSCIFNGNQITTTNAYIGRSYYTIIRNCIFKNARSKHGLYIGGGGYQVIEHNQFINNGEDGIHINVNVDPNLRVLHPIIRFNWFENNAQSYQDQATDSAEIYYNVIINDPSRWSVCMALSYEANYFSLAARNGKVYNNTFIMYDANTSGSTGIFIYGNPFIDGWIIKNNIFYCPNSNSGYLIYQQNGGGKNFTFDNNLYFRKNGSYQWHIKGINYNSFAAWQIAGNDIKGIQGNPMFKNILKKDYSLTKSSPCINKGQNLGLRKDYLGNLISIIPDLGAFQYKNIN